MQAIDPSWTEAMRTGNHPLAWRISDEALKSRDPATRDDPHLPYHLRWVWNGEEIDGKHVLVRCYHGLGDTLQFARFLPELARRAASVMLEVQPRIACLFSSFLIDIHPFDPARPLPPAEVDIEIMELPQALRLTPGETSPIWLETDAFSLPPRTIGICTRSGDWDPDRSIPAHLLAFLAETHPILALDLDRSPLPALNPGGSPYDIPATAALLAGCNLVITVDTMIAHLAGAMGKPLILLLKHHHDWRWQTLAGQCEWYPDFRLLVQPEPGAWHLLVPQIAKEISR